MYRLLLLLMTLATCEQFGMTIFELSQCRSRECLKKVEKHSRDVLKIDWRAITVWSEEAKRFK